MSIWEYKFGSIKYNIKVYNLITGKWSPYNTPAETEGGWKTLKDQVVAVAECSVAVLEGVVRDFGKFLLKIL